jgi:hypothetical protein
MRDENKSSPRSTTVSAASSPEPPSLDETIAATLRLLPDLRALDPTQLRALAVNLRILSNIAEGLAHRAETASECDDE